MYQENSSDFPANVKEVDYLQRMRSCYPIHPEVFDRLYEDWATIERFQKTRGVLRLMAAVVHNLWMNQDGSLLIMPGSLPLDVSTIRDELTRHVGDNWNAIVDHGGWKELHPLSEGSGNSSFWAHHGSPARRADHYAGQRTEHRQDTIRGLEASRIRLMFAARGKHCNVQRCAEHAAISADLFVSRSIE